MSLLSIINREYYLPKSRKIRLIISAGFGLMVFFILISFSPFGLQNISVIPQKVIVVAGYSFIAFLDWFAGLFILKNIKAQKAFLWQFLIALIIIQFLGGASSMVYNNIIFKNDSIFDFFIRFQVIVFLTGMLPSFVLILFLETNYYCEGGIENNSKAEKKISNITIYDENLIKSLSLPPENLIYIQSLDNYIKIEWRTNDGPVKSTILRNTLKSAMSSLSGNDCIVQCHRSYIVNLNFVREVKGNTLTKKCFMQHVDDIIPVSRSRIDFVVNKLKTINQN